MAVERTEVGQVEAGMAVADSSIARRLVELPIEPAHLYATGEALSTSTIFDSYYQILSTSWPSANASTVSNPFGDYLNVALVAARIRGAQRVRFDLDLRIETLPSPHTIGLLKVWYGPRWGTRKLGLILPEAGQAWQKYGVLLDAAQPGVVNLRLPFIWEYETLDVTVAEADQVGQLFLTPVVVLSRDDGLTVAPPRIIVRARALNVYLEGPTQSTIVAQSAMIKGIEDSAMNVMGTVTKRVGKFLGGARSIADALGFSREIVEAHENALISHPSMAQLEGPDHTVPIRMFKNGGVNGDPKVQFGLAEDELTLDYMCGRDSLNCLTTFSSTAAAGDEIRELALFPKFLYIGTGLHKTPSSIGYALSPFGFWRGDVEVTFRVVSSPFQSGSVLITFDPSTSGPSTGSAVGDVRNITLEVRPGSTATFRIGHTINQPYYPLDPNFNDSVTASPVLGTLGMFRIYVHSPLQGPTLTQSCTIVTSVRALPGVRAVGFHDIPTTPLQVQPPDPDPPGFATVEGEAAVVSNVASNGLVTTGGPQTSVTSWAFGEECVSIRALLRKYNAVGIIAPDVGEGAGTFRDRSCAVVFRNYEGYDDVNMGGAPSNRLDLRAPTLYQFFARCYVAEKGGARFSVRAAEQQWETSTPSKTLYKVEMGLPSTAVSFDVVSGGLAVQPDRGFTHFFDESKGEYCDFEVPSYFNQNFRLQSIVPIGSNQNFPYHRLTIQRVTTNLKLYVWEVARACSEDHNLSWYEGPPDLAFP